MNQKNDNVKVGVVEENAAFRAIKLKAEEMERELPGFKFCIIGAKLDNTGAGFDTVAVVNAGYQKIYMQALWDIVNASPEKLAYLKTQSTTH